jgi:hypothetical protein
MKRMPDGSWYDAESNLLVAPEVDPRGGGEFKQPYPNVVDPRGGFSGPQIASQAQMIDGLGSSPMGGSMALHMRQGRNFPALGVLDSLSPTMRKVIAIGAVVGVAALTVWLNRLGAGKKKSK